MTKPGRSPRGPYMTATRRTILEWAADQADSWTLLDCARGTRPNVPEDLARNAVRQVVGPLVERGLVQCVGTTGSFWSKIYAITRDGRRALDPKTHAITCDLDEDCSC